MHLTLLNQGVKRCLVLYVTCIDQIAQVSLAQLSGFLFLDVLTLKLRAIIIILLTNQTKIILPPAHTTKS